jgi:uncharacterized protein YyaL (SSP411 family)
MAARFHFSPRPNRAHEIQWRAFEPRAFEEATHEHKLILLSISAAWCHWCHVMDETTYSDDEVIDMINSGYIPIRVDTDQRPDVNSRYNMGGWPTTAFLTPDGKILTGGTYIPASRMKRLLRDATAAVSRGAVEMRSRPLVDDGPDDESEDESGENPALADEPQVRVDDSDLWDTYEWIRDDLINAYDVDFGGFGAQPKFSMAEALRFAIHDHVLTGNPTMETVATHTLRSMIRGGIYDQVEGGFFRYSTTRDWGIPHFEKMLEDNSQLLDVLVDAYKVTRDETFLRTALDILRYFEVRLYQQDPPAFSGSQDADEAYYSMDASGRRNLTPPYIDRNIYCTWNALAVQAILNLWTVTAEESHRVLALSVAETLKSRLFDPNDGVYHYLDSETHERTLPGILDDQLRFAEMSLRIYSMTGMSDWRILAGQLIDRTIRLYRGKQGMLSDAVTDRRVPGPLSRRLYDFNENARAASLLAWASVILDRDDLRNAGLRIVQALKPKAASHGPFAAGFAHAVADLLRAWTRVTVVGELAPLDGKSMTEFLRVLHSDVRPQLAVMPLDVTANRQEVERTGLPTDQLPVALACAGRICLEPQYEAHSVLRVLDQMKEGGGGPNRHQKGYT